MTDDEDEDIPFPEFEGLWHLREYLRDTWMQNRKHGTFPRVGGYNAQDPKWVHDTRWVNARYNAWFAHWLREKERRTKEGDKDAVPGLLKQGGGAWSERELIGE